MQNVSWVTLALLGSVFQTRIYGNVSHKIGQSQIKYFVLNKSQNSAFCIPNSAFN